MTSVNFSGPSNSTSSSGSTTSGSFSSALIWATYCDCDAGVRSFGGGCSELYFPFCSCRVS